MSREGSRRSDRFLRSLDGFSRAVIITHDNPDPDAIASGWALRELIRSFMKIPVRLIGGGAIVRAENVHLVRLLRPPIELADSFSPDADTASILVDCSSEAANHLLGRDRAVQPVAVVDHHVQRHRKVRLAFRDIRPKAVSAATIAASYLREQGLEPPGGLATALYYAVRTETIGTYRSLARWEHGVVTWLGRFVDYATIAEIENAPLSRPYFAELMLAIGNTNLHGDVAVCFLPKATGAEIVGEVADLLIRCSDIERALCGAVVDDGLVVSSRTTRTGGDAVELIGRTLRGLGHSGGHSHRAGGKIAADGRDTAALAKLIEETRARWLKSCGVEETEGVPLVGGAT